MTDRIFAGTRIKRLLASALLAAAATTAYYSLGPASIVSHVVMLVAVLGIGLLWLGSLIEARLGAAENQLDRLAAAMEHSGDAVAILNADRSYEYLNPQYEVQTGFSATDLKGRMAGVRSRSDPAIYEQLWATCSAGRVWTGHVRSSRKDGSVYDEGLTVTPVMGRHGKISGYVAVMRDISRRLEAERENRQLAQALAHAADSIEILDHEGRILYVNTAFEARGGQRLDDIRGKESESLRVFGDHDDSLREKLHTISDEGCAWSGCLRSKNAADQIVDEEMTISPVRDEQGQITSYVIVKRDVTEKKRLEAQLQQAQKLESIGQLAAGIAHEINTPTQYVSDNVRFIRDAFGDLDQLLQKLGELAGSAQAVPGATLAAALKTADLEFLRDEIPKALEQSADGCERIAKIVRAMKEFSHPSQDKTAVDLNRAIQSTITVATNEWKYVAEVHTEFDARLPPVVCLAGELNQVILNMLVNAAHAIGDVVGDGGNGKGRITVSTGQNHGWAEIRIADTGAGITPEIRNKIFDPFFTTKEVGKGTGQGLAIAHDVVVKKHGGTISVESEIGKGSTFIIRIPLEQPSQRGAIAA